MRNQGERLQRLGAHIPFGNLPDDPRPDDPRPEDPRPRGEVGVREARGQEAGVREARGQEAGVPEAGAGVSEDRCRGIRTRRNRDVRNLAHMHRSSVERRCAV